MIDYGGFRTNPHFNEFHKELADVTTLIDPKHNVAETLVLVFRERLRTNLLTGGPLHSNRSHCTYSIALSLREAANVFELDCLYEIHKRFDGVILTSDDRPLPILFAEWEWDYNDIFGKGKELEKLWDSVASNNTADAILITYCESKEYKDFARKVIQWWQSQHKKKAVYTLYFLTLVFNFRDSSRKLMCLRTMVIQADKVQFWDDIP